MTIKYLKDASTKLAVVSRVRFSAERDILKLIFPFALTMLGTIRISMICQ